MAEALYELVDGEKVEIPPSRASVIRAEWAAAEAEREKTLVKQQIAVLEASITPRRIREALLSGNTWIAGVDAKIATLRAQL